MALLAGIHHERATHPRIGDLLGELERSDLVSDPDSPAAVNVRELRRVHSRLTRLPRWLVEETARTTSMAQQEWVAARKKSDFSHFRHWLEKIVTLKRREAECLGTGPDPYDALIDLYEPGAKSRDIATLFESLRRELVPLVAAIMGSRTRANLAIPRREYPIDRQRVFGESVAAALGFDFQRGRLDTAAHPFCTGIGPGDCRITTRFNPHNFSDGFFGILHETGHGLYDQGLAPEHYGTPMGEAVSIGIHESQSRLWENAVGRSRPFWRHYFPLARQIFREALNDVTLDEFHLAVNHVEPSFIRVEADEATYNLHIFIRFELEQALISDDLLAEDIPGAWNEKYSSYLGITPGTTPRGACKTSTGAPACSGISRPTPSATCSRRSCSPRRTRTSATWEKASPRGIPGSARLAARARPPPGASLPVGPAHRARDRLTPRSSPPHGFAAPEIRGTVSDLRRPLPRMWCDPLLARRPFFAQNN